MKAACRQYRPEPTGVMTTTPTMTLVFISLVVVYFFEGALRTK